MGTRRAAIGALISAIIGSLVGVEFQTQAKKKKVPANCSVETHTCGRFRPYSCMVDCTIAHDNPPISNVNVSHSNMDRSAWFRQVRDSSFVGVSWQYGDARDLSFNFIDFSKANFAYSNFSGTNFMYSTFERADFTGCDLSNANFSRTTLKGANLSGADTTGTVWCRTIMPDGQMNNSGCAS